MLSGLSAACARGRPYRIEKRRLVALPVPEIRIVREIKACLMQADGNASLNCEQLARSLNCGRHWQSD
jgi:hypothetical protein